MGYIKTPMKLDPGKKIVKMMMMERMGVHTLPRYFVQMAANQKKEVEKYETEQNANGKNCISIVSKIVG